MLPRHSATNLGLDRLTCIDLRMANTMQAIYRRSLKKPPAGQVVASRARHSLSENVMRAHSVMRMQQRMSRKRARHDNLAVAIIFPSIVYILSFRARRLSESLCSNDTYCAIYVIAAERGVILTSQVRDVGECSAVSTVGKQPTGPDREQDPFA